LAFRLREMGVNLRKMPKHYVDVEALNAMIKKI
jgi:hypothetical protein